MPQAGRFWPRWQSVHLYNCWPRNASRTNHLTGRLETWRVGDVLPALSHAADGSWVYNDRASLTQDLVTCMSMTDGPGVSQAQAVVLARLEDHEVAVTAGDFRERWRRFLACMNLYQFCHSFTMWTTSEVQNGTAPDLPVVAQVQRDSAWMRVVEQTTSSIRPYVPALSATGIPVPQVEYYHDQFDGDIFAELAWPNLDRPVAVLVGDQATFAGQWQQHGWMVRDSRRPPGSWHCLAGGGNQRSCGGSMTMATLMMHRNLLKQFGKLPVRVQKRMADFIERFQRISGGPRHPSASPQRDDD